MLQLCHSAVGFPRIEAVISQQQVSLIRNDQVFHIGLLSHMRYPTRLAQYRPENHPFEEEAAKIVKAAKKQM